MAGFKRRHLVTLVGVVLTAEPATAQLGWIFGDPPPRPPGDIRRPTIGTPQNYEGTQLPEPSERETRPDIRQPPRDYGPPPGSVSSRPGPVRNEPLPPPPSAAPGALPPPPAATGPLPPTPGQPPAAPANAVPPQRPRATPQPANAAPQPGDEVVVAPPAQKVVNATAVFSGLDKVTGRIISFDVGLDETVQFGALRVTPRACYTRPPTETQNTDAFVEVEEITLQGEVRRIFGGWMFASSPGLHAVEHPIYDVWLSDCKKPTTIAGTQPASQAAPAEATTPAAKGPASGGGRR